MKKLVVVLGAALLIVSIVAVILWQRLNESRTQVADMQAVQHTMEATKVASATALAAQPQQALGKAAAADCPASPAVSAAGDKRQAAGAQRPNASLLDGAKQILSSEQGRALVQPAIRGMIQAQFKDVGKALQLTKEEEDKLIDLLAKQQTELSSASMDLLTNDSSDAASRQALEHKVQEMQRANEAELSTMLGGKYPQYQEFASTMAARQQVDQLRTVLTTSGAELSDAQGKSLVAALAAEQKRITAEASANPVPAGSSRQETLDLQLKRTVETNRQMVETASRYLNTQQLDSYKAMLDQQAEMLKRVLGAMGGNK